MQDFGAVFGLSVSTGLAALDPDLVEIVAAVAAGESARSRWPALIGMPLGRAAGGGALPGRGALIVLINALMGLPPVVVGLLVYLLLSNAGPLGWLQLLYTPTAMIIAQAVLVTPIVAA